jgi:tetratricopeptide (TPR) repeat protein
VNIHSKTDPLSINIHPLAARGIKLFNEGEYYKAHEPLEAAWIETQSPERDLYQGILQIGLAYYQISRGNYRGALKMFKRGQRNLAPLGETILGINITRLREDAKGVEELLREAGDSQIEMIIRSIYQPIPLIE